MSSKSRIIAWSAWLVASIFYTYQYIIRVMPNVMLDDIMTHFSFNAATFGQFSGIYYIGYALMHLPLGILLDRFGPRKVMSISILLTVLGTTPILFTNYWAWPILGRLLIGIGSSASILGIFKIIRITFKESQFTFMLSISVAIGLVGALYGGMPLRLMTESLGYQAVVQIFAFVGIGLAALTYIIVPEMKTEATTSATSNLRLVLGNSNVMWISIIAGLMVGSLEGFADVWGFAFFKNNYGFEDTLAASLPSLIFFGMVFGGTVLSFIAKLTKSYIATIAGCSLVMAVIFILMLMGILTPTTLTVGMFVVGLCCAYQILAIYKASTYVPEHAAGLTTAIANMIIMIFGYGFHSVIGIVVKSFGGTASAIALKYGIAVIPITLLISLVGLIIMLLTEKKSAAAAA